MKTYEDLQQVEVTQGSNGYPEGIYNAYKSDSIKELQEVQANEGGELVILKKRDGWHFFQNEGNTYYDSFIDAPQHEQDFYLVANADNVEEEAFKFIVGDYDGIGEYLAECHPDIKDFDDIKEIIEKIEDQVNDIITEVGDSEEDVLLNFGSTKENLCYSVARDAASFHEDVYTYQYALLKKESEEEDLDWEWVTNEEELEEMKECGYKMLLSISNDNRGKYAVCTESNYKDVFKRITGHTYNDLDATFGSAFSINETFGASSIF